ncbi:hypothetical protein PENSOL_c003G00298 [Penicillium solitum]|uniref:Uncharacterized protein n=1 Tax=Penicillium solitum TaxID=60172 RepID=A0A1V6RJW7_9EURO|nr:uncharacterized protein PENSOL_c003G00298 [Penicillium solitum]OQE02122.1 hypothetical protein PENSOL_c003G00298 [Penicillium solitum]
MSKTINAVDGKGPANAMTIEQIKKPTPATG